MNEPGQTGSTVEKRLQSNNRLFRVAAIAATTIVFAVGLAPCAQADARLREHPPQIVPFASHETHRIRIHNEEQGTVEVSTDQGKTWGVVGRVTAPATRSLMGYLASSYAQPGTICATSVHGIRIRVGDESSAYPLLINVVPAEFSQTPKLFGGHISGVSGIYTNIPVGTSIFRDLAPRAGSQVSLEGADGSLTAVPVNYTPAIGDVLTIVVKAPDNPLTEIDFENRPHGPVSVAYADGTRTQVCTVIKPVYGVGRFDGTSYTGVGAVNTNHTGVITVSTAPVTMSPLFEGEGGERRGGFQIEPVFHNSQSDEVWADMIMVIGTRKGEHEPTLEGTPPLFDGYLDLTWLPQDMAHSWRAQMRRGKGGWQPMVQAIGNKPHALLGVTAIRIVRDNVPSAEWFANRLQADIDAYKGHELALARAGKLPIKRGVVVIAASVTDPNTHYVSFYVNGQFRAISNSTPYSFTWDTTSVPDGEYVVEARAQDANSKTISTTRMRMLVDNEKRASAT